MSTYLEPPHAAIEHDAEVWNQTVLARWPERIVELAAEWPRNGDSSRRERTVSEFWLLLNAALAKYARIHAARLQPLPVEDLRDIASEKALELLQKVDVGRWNPCESTPAQLCTLVSTVARNGVIDRLRSDGPRRLVSLDTPESEAGLSRRIHRANENENGETALDRRRFVVALRDCVRQLSSKARHAWFLRVLEEAPTKLIARHPEVSMNPGGVDVMLARSRAKVKRCMARKGHAPRRLPPGTFATLWELFHERKP